MSPKKQVDRWNRAVSVGDPVLVTMPDGRQVEAVTAGPAYLVGGQAPAVRLAGLGVYGLDHVARRDDPQLI